MNIQGVPKKVRLQEGNSAKLRTFFGTPGKRLQRKLNMLRMICFTKLQITRITKQREWFVQCWWYGERRETSIKSFCERFIKIRHQEPGRCAPSLSLESRRKCTIDSPWVQGGICNRNNLVKLQDWQLKKEVRICF